MPCHKSSSECKYLLVDFGNIKETLLGEEPHLTESSVCLKDPYDKYAWFLDACGMTLQGENRKQLNNISNFLNRNHCSPWSVIQTLFEP